MRRSAYNESIQSETRALKVNAENVDTVSKDAPPDILGAARVEDNINAIQPFMLTRRSARVNFCP